MNEGLRRLQTASQRDHRIVLGLMSGTSLDGLDLALCKISGQHKQTKVELLHFHTVPYPPATIKRLALIKEAPSLQNITLLHAWLGNYHGELVLHALEIWKVNPNSVDFIASHGQTVYHAPQSSRKDTTWPNATLQIGDADHIAQITGIPTFSDFRQKHIAAGGEGAPLAVYGDYLLFSHNTQARILLNIGGIANFTALPALNSSEKLLVTDTGPGNTLMDSAMQFHFNQKYDQNGTQAAKGKLIPVFLEALEALSFYRLPYPKSTGTEYFNIELISQIWPAFNSFKPAADIIKTLNFHTAKSIVKGIQSLPDHFQEASIYVSGGGAKNAVLLQTVQDLLPNHKIFSTQTLGVNVEAKEAIIFALLANECLMGSRVNIPGIPAVSMGKISLPN